MPTPTKGPRLGGGPAHERLLLANLAAALFTHKSIKTTETKAKRLRPVAERLITFAKRGDLHARRRVLAVIGDKSVVHELFTEIAPLVELREGGYTRITKLGYRKGDNAPMVQIELVLEPVNPKPKSAKKTAAAEAKAAAPAKKAAPAADEAEVDETDASEAVAEDVAADETAGGDVDTSAVENAADEAVTETVDAADDAELPAAEPAEVLDAEVAGPTRPSRSQKRLRRRTRSSPPSHASRRRAPPSAGPFSYRGGREQPQSSLGARRPRPPTCAGRRAATGSPGGPPRSTTCPRSTTAFGRWRRWIIRTTRRPRTRSARTSR